MKPRELKETFRPEMVRASGGCKCECLGDQGKGGRWESVSVGLLRSGSSAIKAEVKVKACLIGTQ